MKIIKPRYHWLAPLTKRGGAPPGVVEHHSDGYGSALDIHRIHQGLKPPNKGIGYHLYVRLDGRVYAGRPLDTWGAHCLHHNDWIGVCAEGRYENKHASMPAAQLKALQEVSDYLRQKYGANLTFKRHKGMPGNVTACPGRSYPFKKIVAGVPNEIELTDRNITVPRIHKPGRPGWWNLGLVKYIAKVRKQGDGKRVDTKRPDDKLVIPVPVTRPRWWGKMYRWKKSQR